MRCPSCKDDFEPHVTWCGSCRVALVTEDAPEPVGPPDTKLGVFHPAVGEVLLAQLDERDVSHETVTRAEGLEILVPRGARDDLRAELTLGWDELVAQLPEELADDVRRGDGPYAGWEDAPQGGWIDRQGRMVVDADEDAQADAARTVGPTLAIGGVALLLLAWYFGMGMGAGFAGVALVLFGLLLPR